MHTILSLFMAVAMTMNTSLSALGVRDALSRAPARVAREADVLEPADPVSAREGTDWDDMEYTHYDPAVFYSKTDRLTDLADGEDADAVIALYDEIYDMYVKIDSLDSIAYAHYCADVTDQYWSDERIYSETLLADTGDAVKAACAAVMDGPCADAFADHVGDEAATCFAEYAPMSDREAELVAREAELVDQYYTLTSTANQSTYTYLGETWTQDMLDTYQGTNLINNDYDGYLEVFYGLQKADNDQVAPIFAELVQLRSEIAQLHGYDSYADMAYQEQYGRDYTTADAQTMCDMLKPVAREYYDKVYYAGTYWDETGIEPAMDPEDLIRNLGKVASLIDPILEEPWQFMSDHGLCLLTDDANAFPGGYTVTIGAYDSPMIFYPMMGDYYDFETMTHEFGHYANFYYDSSPHNLLTDTSSYDLMEIPSTGLEMLATEKYGHIFTNDADAARALALDQQMITLINGCIHDEFQRRVYEDPDMTVDEMNQLFAQICSEYGLYEPFDVDYSWIYVPHTFESPLYYISYAASTLVAIQIWDIAREDFDAGMEVWKTVLSKSPYNDKYMTVLQECGLRPFTEEGAVEEICAPLIDELVKLLAIA